MKNGDSRLSTARWLFRVTDRLLPAFGVSTAARILGQLAGVALLVVAVTTPMGVRSLGLSVGLLVALALFKGAARYLEHYAGHWLAFTALQRLRELYFTRLIPQAPSGLGERSSAALAATGTTDIGRIEVFFAHTFPPAISAVVVPTLVTAWLGISLSWPVAAIVGAGCALMIVFPIAMAPMNWRSARRESLRDSRIAGHVGDDIQGLREVVGFGVEEQRLAELDRLGRVPPPVRATVQEMVKVAVSLGVVIGVVIAAPGWREAMVSAAAVVALIVPVRALEDFAGGLDAALAAAERVRRLIDAPPLVVDGPGVDPAALGPRSVEFQGVTLPGRLAGVTMSVPAGRWSALVGVSGSGKSSAALLAVRGGDPRSGTISLAGRDIREFTLADLRRRVAYVSQRPTALGGTVAENLRLPDPRATDERLFRALHAVDLNSPLGARVAERGTSMSGGQLQRLALARALVGGPEVLILDEALSQLDAHTAFRVRKRVAEHYPGLTVLEITHRTDMLPGDTPVTVLDGGRVVERGTVSQLRGAGGAFDALEARVT